MRRGGAFWHRAQSVLAATLRWFPMTPLGVLALAASLWALIGFGLKEIDLPLLVIGIFGTALVTVSALLVLVGALIIRRRLAREDGREALPKLELECGYPRRTGFELPTLWALPLVRVGWSVLHPVAHLHITRHGMNHVEEIAAVERAHRELIVRRIVVADVLGLAEVALLQKQPRTLKCYPAVGNLRQVQVVQSLSVGDQIPHPDAPAQGEPIDMRHYAPGDPIRSILWKVFARTRELVVRSPERAFGPTPQTVAYLVRGPLDEPAAGAARVAVECNALGSGGSDWVLGADGIAGHADGPRRAMELLAQSGEVPFDEGGTGLAPFLESALPGGVHHAIVFVPAKEGPWLPRVLRTAQVLRGIRLTAMVCMDGVEERGEKGWLARLLRREEPALDPRRGVGPVSSQELAAVCRALGRAGFEVTVLDRVQGRVHAAAHHRFAAAAKKTGVAA